MRFSLFLLITGLFLWTILGGVILSISDNYLAVLVWAATTGVCFLMMLMMDFKMREDKEKEQKYQDYLEKKLGDKWK